MGHCASQPRMCAKVSNKNKNVLFFRKYENELNRQSKWTKKKWCAKSHTIAAPIHACTMRTQIKIKQNTHNAHTIAFVYLFLILVFGCVLVVTKKRFTVETNILQ